MTTPAATGSAGHEAAPVHPQLDAGQVLRRLLELIRSSKTIKDFTPDYLSKAMGVELVTYRPGYHAFGEQVAADWWYSLEMNDNVSPIIGPRLSFSFNAQAGTSPDMTDICQVDFEQFASELESMGFSRERRYGSHGSMMNDLFIRSGMAIEVYPRGEANEPIDKISRLCVQMVLLR